MERKIYLPELLLTTTRKFNRDDFKGLKKCPYCNDYPEYKVVEHCERKKDGGYGYYGNVYKLVCPHAETNIFHQYIEPDGPLAETWLTDFMNTNGNYTERVKNSYEIEYIYECMCWNDNIVPELERRKKSEDEEERERETYEKIKEIIANDEWVKCSGTLKKIYGKNYGFAYNVSFVRDKYSEMFAPEDLKKISVYISRWCCASIFESKWSDSSVREDIKFFIKHNPKKDKGNLRNGGFYGIRVKEWS